MNFKRLIPSTSENLSAEDKKRKTYSSSEDQQATVVLWKNSGLSQVQFCEEQGLHPKTFSRWVKLHDHSDSATKLRKKKEVLSNSSVTRIEYLVVKLSTGIIIRLEGDLKSSQFSTLIQDFLQ